MSKPTQPSASARYFHLRSFFCTLAAFLTVIFVLWTAGPNVSAQPPGSNESPVIGTRPVPPPGYTAVLRPGRNGSYWVLVPSGTQSTQPQPSTNEPNPQAETGSGPNPTASSDPLLPEPADLALNLELLEREVIDETNTKRAEADLPPLQPHPVLELAARGHSAAMAKTGQLSHSESTSGRETVEARTRLAGASGWSKIAENVAKGHFPEPIAKTIVTTFFESAGHRKNMMDSDQQLIGIGIVTDGQTLYVTQVFAANLTLAPVEAMPSSGARDEEGE